MSKLTEQTNTAKVPKNAVVLPARTYAMSEDYADKLTRSGISGKFVKRVAKMGPIRPESAS